LNQYNTKPSPKDDEEMAPEDSTNGSPTKREQTPVTAGEASGFARAGGHQIKNTQAMVDAFEGTEGFKTAGNGKKLEMKVPLRSEDFSFLKKTKVKFNCVDL
jgi:hypothetical protein